MRFITTRREERSYLSYAGYKLECLVCPLRVGRLHSPRIPLARTNSRPKVYVNVLRLVLADGIYLLPFVAMLRCTGEARKVVFWSFLSQQMVGVY